MVLQLEVVCCALHRGGISFLMEPPRLVDSIAQTPQLYIGKPMRPTSCVMGASLCQLSFCRVSDSLVEQFV